MDPKDLVGIFNLIGLLCLIEENSSILIRLRCLNISNGKFRLDL